MRRRLPAVRRPGIFLKNWQRLARLTPLVPNKIIRPKQIDVYSVRDFLVKFFMFMSRRSLQNIQLLCKVVVNFSSKKISFSSSYF